VDAVPERRIHGELDAIDLLVADVFGKQKTVRLRHTDDQVVDLAVEVARGGEPTAIDERLVEADRHLGAAFGIEIRVAEAGKEKLVQRRRLEALRVVHAQARSRGAELIARSARWAHRTTEAIVVIDANAAGEHEPAFVEE
jgi:hypothetical protein